MFKTRTRKIFADIWTRKVRTLLTAVSIFIGVFGVVSLTSAGEILVTQLEKDLQPEKLAMLRSSIILNRNAEADNTAALDQLRQQEGVEIVEGRAVYPLFWRLEDEDRFREGTVAAHSEPFDESQIEPPRLMEGRYPESTGSQDRFEIGIERRMADEFGLKVGDQIVIRVLSETSGDTIKTATGEIVGIIFQPYEYSSLGNLVSRDSLVLADYQDASYLGGFRGFNNLYARFEDFPTAEAEQTAFVGSIGQTGYIPTYTTIEDPEKNGQIERTRSTNRLLVIL
ncbi:MAG: ABC transporter permease, partial [Anaerolineae bacterium]|nr:ABC transporter permease [Anaerolineae bacterium]